MKYLGEGMKFLPKKLKQLGLYLEENDLGKNPEGMKYLEKIM